MATISHFLKLVTRQAFAPSRRTGAHSRGLSSPAAIRRPDDVQPLSMGPEDLQTTYNFAEVNTILRNKGDQSQTRGPPADDFTSREFNRGGQDKHRESAYQPLGHQLFVRPSDFTRAGRRIRTISRMPWDLGPSAAQAKRTDIFQQLQIDPVHEATNSMLMTHYVTKMGRILSRAETGLSWRSQRKLGKAIRRARMMGIIPQLSRRKLRPLKVSI